MIKLLFFIEGLSGGGAEKVLRNLVNNMDQTKFDITVQTIDECDPGKYLADGIHYKSINHYKTKLGKKIFSYWFRLCAELKLAYRFFVRDDYDIEVAYLETSPTKIIAQSTNKKAVKIAWVHCDLSKKEGMDASADKGREQYKKFNKVVCVSEDVKDGFYKIYGDNFDTVVLHNVIDENEIFLKAVQSINFIKNTDEKQLLAVGRLTQQKNFAHLIDTCGKLMAKEYKFHLNILGEGPERKNLEKQIENLGLQKIVTLQGFISNPYPWIKQSDVMVCSSIYEGISTVVQEALILGKPVVTTPCTGMTELLGNSEYGLIADDTPDGLYNSLVSVLDSDIVLAKYTEKATRRGTYFSKSRVVKETEDLFCKILTDVPLHGGKS